MKQIIFNLKNKPESMRPEIYELEQQVRFSDTDAAGIVYFGMFATYFDESVITALREFAINLDSPNSKETNFLLPIVESKAQFFGPLRAGDHFKVLMVVVKLSQRSFKTEHMIVREVDGHEELIAVGYISRVCVDKITFKPCSMDENLQEALNAHYLEPDAWQEHIVKMKEIQRKEIKTL